MLTSRAIVLLALLTALAAGCSPATPTVPAAPGQALIESVDIRLLESFPVQVQVAVRGNLPDGCTALEENTVERDGNTFRIMLNTQRLSTEGCTEALVPFEETIPLDVAGLTAGTYTVDVNGMTSTFSLDVDNILPEQIQIEGTPGEEGEPLETITWEEAQTLLLDGQVTQVFQTHALQVTLVLADGRRVQTTEPTIDDIFAVIEQCGSPCANIVVATE